MFLTFHVSFLYLQKSLYRKYLRRVCQDCNENLVGWMVTVRNFADNTRGWRASVLSLGPNSAAEIETGLADLGLCGDQGWRLRSGAVDARAPDLSPGEQTKRIKRPVWSFPPGPRLSSGRAPLGPGDDEPGTGNRYFRWSVLSAGVRHFKSSSHFGETATALLFHPKPQDIFPFFERGFSVGLKK